MVAKAKADAFKQIGASLKNEGADAASLTVAEQYVQAFKHLAKAGNTLILPQDASNVAGTVAQAFQVYNSLASAKSNRALTGGKRMGREEYDSGSDLEK